MFSKDLEVSRIEHDRHLQNRGRSGHKTKEQHILLVYRVHCVANEYDKGLKKKQNRCLIVDSGFTKCSKALEVDL
jgi:hypothetical protein